MNQITRLISIDNVKGDSAWAYANDKGMERFNKLGIEYKLLPHPGSLIKPAMTNSTRDLRDWTSYPTYSAYVAQMNQFATTYPNLCRIEEIGTTLQGRKILVAKISDNVSSHEAEPEVWYLSTIHGDETTGFILMLRLIDYLLSNYGTDQRVTQLVNNLEIWITPAGNPDGTYHGGDNTVSGSWRGNSNGIDINRNYPDPAVGDHPDENAYQLETLATMNFMSNHHFVMSANFHGGAEVVNYPWDCWSRLHPDNDWMVTVARQYADKVHQTSPSTYMDDLQNGITNGYAWYCVYGGRQDYLTYFKHDREMTIELSNTKLLPTTSFDAHWNYNRESLLSYLENANYGIHGIVKDRSGNSLDARIDIDGHDADNSYVVTDPACGDFYRYIAPGNYTLAISANGFPTKIIDNVIVVANQVTNLDVVLDSNPSQLLTLNNGWNLISLNVHPSDMSPDSVFASVGTHLEQLKNLTLSYSPHLPSYLNTLNELVDGQGYWAKVDQTLQQNVVGRLIDPALTTIPLHAGWNLVGFVSTVPEATETALSSIMSNILQVKSLTQTYQPTNPSYLNSLTNLETGKGYWINVSSDCSLNYPSNTVVTKSINRDHCPVPSWNITVYPNNSATVYGRISIPNGNLSNLDWISAFIDGECVGLSPIVENEGQFYCSLVINMPYNHIQPNYYYWKHDDNSIVQLEQDTILEFGQIYGDSDNGILTFNMTTVSNGDISMVESSYTSVYPNPVRNNTDIHLTGKEISHVSLYNLRGQIVQEWVLGKNRDNMTVNLDKVNGRSLSLPNGIYFMRISSAKGLEVKKIMLIK